MSLFQVDVFKKQFSFLGNDLDGQGALVPDWDEVEEVKVSRISPEFLDNTPRYQGATGSLVSIEDNKQIFLLNKQGVVLTEVRQKVDITHHEAHFENEEEEGETVGEAIFSLEDPKEVIYALCIHTGYVVHDHRSVGGFTVKLYKPPKGFSLTKWVEKQLDKAEALISAEIAEIDAEGRV